MAGLLAKVEETMRARGLCPPGAKMVAAVSGGVDSMVLLHCLTRLAARHSWHITAAHFNHSLRGRSSDADARFVERESFRLGISCLSERGNVRSHAEAQRLSIEMAARELRHAFLARAAAAAGASIAATAHHADDQVELFFLRLLRGAGSDGLGGMPWRGPSPADFSLALIRPLLNCAKAELIEFARAEGIRFREDASNRTLDFQRNRIRRQLLPLLRRSYQPGVERTVARAAELLRAEADYLQQAARQWQAARERVSFAKLHEAVQRRVLQMELLRLGVAPGFELIEELRSSPDHPVTVAPGLILARNADGAVRKAEGAAPFTAGAQAQIRLTGRSGVASCGGRSIHWRKEPVTPALLAEARAQKSPRTERFDADKIGEVVELRHWQPGDRMTPIGRRTSVKLQDLFVKARVPRPERGRRLVAATAAGEIFWVEGLRISETFKLDNTSACGLIWEMRE